DYYCAAWDNRLSSGLF
nr:immunoglobulin light chain junction region [Macaca mulatta]MOW57031.1 immunoglobulin light chain junction region [Macaca mulatta]MOW57148.1 immunoglobulin light chain junction region [Macaca mulatta]MOW58262.1 immunoglobulin light chain junction region [Macaca mulatta]MOW59370.1 immunoglobulin light chain junction region [Macaca mulatta]